MIIHLTNSIRVCVYIFIVYSQREKNESRRNQLYKQFHSSVFTQQMKSAVEIMFFSRYFFCICGLFIVGASDKVKLSGAKIPHKRNDILLQYRLPVRAEQLVTRLELVMLYNFISYIGYYTLNPKMRKNVTEKHRFSIAVHFV